MFLRIITVIGVSWLGAACGGDTTTRNDDARRIVSLDFCADQYLIAFADSENIAGVSPDATKSFSYYRDVARALPVVPPRAEDILVKRPDAVIRTYGGGPNITRFLERAGVEVIQIDYASDLEGVRRNAVAVAAALGRPDRGVEAAADMARRLSALPDAGDEEILYLTSKGAVAGRDTLIDELIERSGRKNFQETPGWGALALEKLAYEHPAAIAAAFFDGSDAATDRWTPARHPVARRALNNADVIEIPGAWTACSAWFITEAAEALAAP